MAIWNAGQIYNINEGSQPNDGTGDSIRDAFTKVDENFANISTFLAQPTVEFLNANVLQSLNVSDIDASNIQVNAVTSNTITNSGTVTANLLVANSGIVSNGNLAVSGNIVPGLGGVYDLGSAANPFRTLYYVSAVTGGTVQTSDAGQIVVHANTVPGDVKDVGVLGNVSHHYPSNTYAFFGYQYESDSFVYKLTPTNPTLGNSVVWDGWYGGARFGNMFISNTTPCINSNTGALVVAGGVGVGSNVCLGGMLNVGGNAYVGGNVVATSNMYSGGYQVLTTNTPGLTTVYPGSLVANSMVITATNPSINTTTGALILSFGGLGMAGNLNVGLGANVAGNVVAGGLVGPYYGTIQTASQPNITGLGSITTLNFGSGSGTSISAQNLTVTSLANFSGATVSGISGLVVTGNISAGNISAIGIYSNVVSQAINTGTITATGNITVTNGSFHVGNVSGTIANFSGNVSANFINANAAAVTGLIFNPTIQTINSNIVGANAAIVTANTAMKNYVDARDTVITNAWTANAATQQGTINSLTANAVTQQGTINTLVAGAYANANVASYFSTFTANIQTGNLTVLDQITINSDGNPIAIVNGATDGIGNIGSLGRGFNTVFAKATSAQYADLAENYTADFLYEPGTVVIFGGLEEITTTTIHGDARVAGAISTNPAYLMNSSTPGLPVALRGRIPLKVIGAVRKGDSLVTSNTAGYAVSVGIELNWGQAVFAKSLETNLDAGEKTIEAVIL